MAKAGAAARLLRHRLTDGGGPPIASLHRRPNFSRSWCWCVESLRCYRNTLLDIAVFHLRDCAFLKVRCTSHRMDTVPWLSFTSHIRWWFFFSLSYNEHFWGIIKVRIYIVYKTLCVYEKRVCNKSLCVVPLVFYYNVLGRCMWYYMIYNSLQLFNWNILFFYNFIMAIYCRIFNFL